MNKLSFTTEKVIKKFKSTHSNKYDYSKVHYSGMHNKVEIICPEHGSFFQRPNNHILGVECRQCSLANQGLKKRLTTKQFIEKSREMHGDRYNYSKSKYITHYEKVIITCRKHGDFKQNPYTHFMGSGCCRCKDPKGEKFISKILKSNNIIFEPQKRFKECRNIYVLSFDFYIPSLNMCIEYDGLQHFKSIPTWGGDKKLMEIQQRDQIKTDFCKDNNIKLLRISYNENILEKLKGAKIV